MQVIVPHGTLPSPAIRELARVALEVSRDSKPAEPEHIGELASKAAADIISRRQKDNRRS